MTSKSIFIGKDSFLFLDRICRKQRGCDILCDASENNMWSRASSRLNGKYQVMEFSFGGGNGSNDHRTWTNWSVDTVKSMLDKAGLPYEEGPEVEYMNI